MFDSVRTLPGQPPIMRPCMRMPDRGPSALYCAAFLQTSVRTTLSNSQAPHLTIETTVIALREGERASFYFFHLGGRKYCFDTEGSLSWRKLEVGQLVRVQGHWSAVAEDVFEADSIVPLT